MLECVALQDLHQMSRCLPMMRLPVGYGLSPRVDGNLSGF